MRNMRKVKDVRATASCKAAWSLAQSIIDPPPRNLAGFLSSAIFTWIIEYLKVAFTPRHMFPTYSGTLSSRPGIFGLHESCKVALVGDWGSGTENAYRVMESIRHRQKPNMTIHLGDIYYSGQVAEVNSYFLGPDDWYRAERSFALNGNHEMYSGGTGYFEHVLPALGQETSYFCLENKFWRIVGLDRVVFADQDDRRPVILLTHHQWFSAFDRGYSRKGLQLRPHLAKVALWFWGHEHRLAGYAPFAPEGGVKVRARCIGHGGMPVERVSPVHPEVRAVFVDDGVTGGVNGKIRSGSQKLTWLRHRGCLVQ